MEQPTVEIKPPATGGAGPGPVQSPAEGQDDTSSRPPTTGADPPMGLSLWFGFGIMLLISGSVISGVSSAFGAWAKANWVWLVIGYAVVGVVTFIASKIPAAQKRLGQLSEATKSALVVFVIIPSIVLAVLAVPFLPQEYRVAVVHAVFVLILCLLPGAMYYLFIVSRRPSILNEYVANLTRLGLIGGRNDDASEPAPLRRRRVESYVQRFESVYGPIRDKRDELVNELAGSSRGNLSTSPGALAYGDVRTGDIAQVFPREVLVQLFMTTVLLALGWLLVLPPAIQSAEAGAAPIVTAQSALVPQLTPVNLAFVGAYFFTLQMLFRRFVRRDLNVKVYVNVCIRVVLAVIAAWVVAVLYAVAVPAGELTASGLLTSAFDTTDRAATPVLIIAFACGVFPRTLWHLIVSTVKKLPGISILLPGLEAGQPLSDLDGVTVWHESRLEEEDVENVSNMATVDLLELMLQTRFPPERLVRWIDEAILLTSLGTPSKKTEPEQTPQAKLQQRGIITATDLYICYLACEHSDDTMTTPLGADLAPAARQIVESLRIKSSNFSLLRAWYSLDGTGSAEESEDAMPAGAMDEDEAPRYQSNIASARKVAGA